MSSERISVVVPCYNDEEYIQSAIQSVLDQREAGVEDIEVIVVDDCSTDNSLSKIEAMVVAHPATIKLIRQPENLGLSAARNAGLRRVTGSLICFLDSDDEYAPGFFAKCLPHFRTVPNLAAIITEVELAECHREIHPVQYEAIVGTLATNVIARTAVVDLIGGFPEGESFRSGGEDAEFKRCLIQEFVTWRLREKCLRYFVHRGSNFDSFLDRTRVAGNQLVFEDVAALEESLKRADAARAYVSAFHRRIQGAALCKRTRSIELLVDQVASFDQLRRRFENVPASPLAIEGYSLYAFAKFGKAEGEVVQIGNLLVGYTCWLAAGCQSSRRGKVFIVVDDFTVPQGHLSSSLNGIDGFAKMGVNYLDLERKLRENGLLNWVEPLIGTCSETARGWSKPIRLLVVCGNESYDQLRNRFDTWAGHLEPAGVVAFQNVEVWPDLTKFYRKLLGARDWCEVMRTGSLHIVQRVAGVQKNAREHLSERAEWRLGK